MGEKGDESRLIRLTARWAGASVLLAFAGFIALEAVLLSQKPESYAELLERDGRVRVGRYYPTELTVLPARSRVVVRRDPLLVWTGFALPAFFLILLLGRFASIASAVEQGPQRWWKGKRLVSLFVLTGLFLFVSERMTHWSEITLDGEERQVLIRKGRLFGSALARVFPRLADRTEESFAIRYSELGRLALSYDREEEQFELLLRVHGQATGFERIRLLRVSEKSSPLTKWRNRRRDLHRVRRLVKRAARL